MLENFADDPPAELRWADDLLMRYGRWAAGRGRGGRTCGSAEGAYRAPVRGDDDARRMPAPVGIDTSTAMMVQRTLVRVPERERTVLHVLYVPQQRSVAAQLRALQITARDCRTRHASGLRFFATSYRLAFIDSVAA